MLFKRLWKIIYIHSLCIKCIFIAVVCRASTQLYLHNYAPLHFLLCRIYCVFTVSASFSPPDDRNGSSGSVNLIQPPPGPAVRQGSGPQPPHGGPGLWGRHPEAPARSHGAAGHRSAQGGVSCSPGHEHRGSSEHTGYDGYRFTLICFKRSMISLIKKIYSLWVQVLGF